MIIGLGEILFDHLPTGAKFGGAPANFACHVARLGGDAHMVSAVGRDKWGDKALQTLRSRKVCIDHVEQLADYPTGAVHVQIDSAGHATYTFGEDDAWDHLAWSEPLAELGKRTKAVCFGTLGQRSIESRQVIQQFVRSVPETAFTIFDVNLRPPYYDDHSIADSLHLANGLKLNDEELPQLARQFHLAGSHHGLLAQLADRFQLKLVALTRGAQGAVLYRDGELHEQAGQRVEVRDTVGAGDAYTAALVLGLLAGDNLAAINAHACNVSAQVCSQDGAV